MGLFSNFKSAVLDDLIKPSAVKEGSIIRCDFLAGHHSGVVHNIDYFNQLRVADVSRRYGSHYIADVSAKDFIPSTTLENDGLSSIFGLGLGGICVACDENANVLHSKFVSLNAQASLGLEYPDYSIKGKNCHMYSSYCLMGGRGFERKFGFDLFPELFYEVPDHFKITDIQKELGFDVEKCANAEEFYSNGILAIVKRGGHYYLTKKAKDYLQEFLGVSSTQIAQVKFAYNGLEYATDWFSNFDHLEDAIKDYYGVNKVRWLKINAKDEDL